VQERERGGGRENLFPNLSSVLYNYDPYHIYKSITSYFNLNNSSSNSTLLFLWEKCWRIIKSYCNIL